MANNRAYLKCSICGKSLFLLKTIGRGWYYPEPSNPPPLDGKNYANAEEYKNSIEQFFTDHDECDESPRGCINIGGTAIVVEYEIEHGNGGK